VNFYPGPDGQPRIWYEPEEIESITEDELKRAGVFPTPKDPVTDLEPLIEVHLKAKLDQYAELSPDVLGVTHFQTRQRVNISINRLLTEAAEETPPRPGVVGRWRATMAHEASHVILHRYLFDPILAGTIVSGSNVAKPEYDRLMRCLNSNVVPQDSANWNRTRSTKDWREVQANMGMAALLMPRRLFSRIAHQKIDELMLTGLAKGSPSSNALCLALSEIFRVSKQATAIRLESLDIVSVP
jgi:hypothetical protein